MLWQTFPSRESTAHRSPRAPGSARDIVVTTQQCVFGFLVTILSACSSGAGASSTRSPCYDISYTAHPTGEGTVRWQVADSAPIVSSFVPYPPDAKSCSVRVTDRADASIPWMAQTPSDGSIFPDGTVVVECGQPDSSWLQLAFELPDVADAPMGSPPRDVVTKEFQYTASCPTTGCVFCFSLGTCPNQAQKPACVPSFPSGTATIEMATGGLADGGPAVTDDYSRVFTIAVNLDSITGGRENVSGPAELCSYSASLSLSLRLQQTASEVAVSRTDCPAIARVTR
jgi:hypothetical protein